MKNENESLNDLTFAELKVSPSDMQQEWDMATHLGAEAHFEVGHDNRGIHIFDFFSRNPKQGEARELLLKLKAQFGHISTTSVTEDSESAISFWQKMLDEGVVASAVRTDGIQLTVCDSSSDCPDFKTWFEGSVVVDSDNKPLSVFHGTASNFSKFNLGRGAVYFTSDAKVASEYARHAEGFDDVGNIVEGASNVIQAYLKITNPFVIDEKWAKENLDGVEDVNGRNWTVLDDFLYEAKESGHDGAILRGVVDYCGLDTLGKRTESAYDQYIVFNCDQIKFKVESHVNYKKEFLSSLKDNHHLSTTDKSPNKKTSKKKKNGNCSPSF